MPGHMPTRPPHPCPRCGTLVTGRRYCPPCTTRASREREAHRGNRHQRGYNHEYQKARAAVLTPDARCHWCGAPATVADHLTPLSRGGTNDLTNLVPSCVPCNARRITH